MNTHARARAHTPALTGTCPPYFNTVYRKGQVWGVGEYCEAHFPSFPKPFDTLNMCAAQTCARKCTRARACSRTRTAAIQHVRAHPRRTCARCVLYPTVSNLTFSGAQRCVARDSHGVERDGRAVTLQVDSKARYDAATVRVRARVRARVCAREYACLRECMRSARVPVCVCVTVSVGG
jgi:hypothetical protein